MPNPNDKNEDLEDDTVGVRAPDLSEDAGKGDDKIDLDDGEDLDDDEDDLEDGVLDDDKGVDA